jgi:hypothetical protein
MIARRADQRDALGREEAVERMRHSSSVLFLLLLACCGSTVSA